MPDWASQLVCRAQGAWPQGSADQWGSVGVTSLSLPNKLWLTKFSEDSGNIAIDGVGVNQTVVAEFMRNLGNSPYYENVELAVTEQTKLGDVKVQKFSLSCRAEKPKR